MDVIPSDHSAWCESLAVFKHDEVRTASWSHVHVVVVEQPPPPPAEPSPAGLDPLGPAVDCHVTVRDHVMGGARPLR